MRSAIRTYRGHYHLWLWGLIWIAMAMLAEFRGLAGIRLFPWLSLLGVAVSVALGFLQSRQIRTPVDKRFLAVLAAVFVFAAVTPLELRAPVDNQIIFAYIGLVVMLCYVISGIWFDSYLFWLGLAMAALILVGLWCFPGIFWWWIAVFGGGPLILTGFYIRYFWR
jgi:hypothetical protein